MVGGRGLRRRCFFFRRTCFECAPRKGPARKIFVTFLRLAILYTIVRYRYTHRVRRKCSVRMPRILFALILLATLITRVRVIIYYIIHTADIRLNTEHEKVISDRLTGGVPVVSIHRCGGGGVCAVGGVT